MQVACHRCCGSSHQFFHHLPQKWVSKSYSVMRSSLLAQNTETNRSCRRFQAILFKTPKRMCSDLASDEVVAYWQETQQFLFRSREALKLYMRVRDEGAVIVELHQKQIECGSRLLAQRREIHLCKQSPHWAPLVLFQLNNMAAISRILQIERSQLSATAYTDQMLQVDWQSAISTHKTAQEAAKMGLWPPQWDRFKEVFDHQLPGDDFLRFCTSSDGQLLAKEHQQQWEKRHVGKV